MPEAEDALFAALDLGAGEELRRRGREFFEGVAGESESYYLEHGLSEDEVRAIVDELRDR